MPKSRCAVVILASSACILAFAGRSSAELTHAQEVLINRGLQRANLATSNDVYHFSTYQAAGYNLQDWGFNSDISQLPNMPWSRWVSDSTQLPGGPNHTDETPYLGNLVSLQLADELNLNDPAVFATQVALFQQARAQLPGVLLYTNNYSGQASDQTISNLVAQAHPDMLCFDMYPFQSVYNPNGGTDPNNRTDYPAIGGVPTAWLSELRRYRQNGIGYNIPVGIYTQTFHAIEGYDARVYRDPSDSELRYNNTAALAFNVKQLMGFEYNASSAMALFTPMQDRPGHLAYGDTYPNDGSPGRNSDLYSVQQDVNRRIANLGKALVQLKPVNDLHNPNDTSPPPGPASGNVNFPDGTTTSILILKQTPGAATGGLPIGFQDDPPLPKSASWWESGKNDPYLNGWAVKNLGSMNGGKPGEVIISWFTPLDESLDGPGYNNEVYMMVVNGLTDPSGSGADCAQDIKLNFLGSVPGIEELDPETGALTFPSLTTISGGKKQLDLTLDGGDGILLKFNDGAPFVGVNNQSFVPEPAGLSVLALCPVLLRRRRGKSK